MPDSSGPEPPAAANTTPVSHPARAQLHALVRSLRTSWDDGASIERAAYLVGALLMLSGLVHILVLLASGGTWTGPLSLRKPGTFGLSFGLTLATVTWVTHHILIGARPRAILLGAFTVACVVETGLVSVQAWRGVPSHFNFTTPGNTAVSMTLAFGGFALVLMVLAWTLAALRRLGAASPSMRLAVRFGMLTLLASLGVGAAMIATGVSQPEPELAYSAAGFLKPAHAVAMHAVLVIPGLAWLLTFTRWPEQTRLRIVLLGTAGYLLLAVVVLFESVARIPPFDAPLGLTLASILGLVTLVLAGGIAGFGVLRRHA